MRKHPTFSETNIPPEGRPTHISKESQEKAKAALEDTMERSKEAESEDRPAKEKDCDRGSEKKHREKVKRDFCEAFKRETGVSLDSRNIRIKARKEKEYFACKFCGRRITKGTAEQHEWCAERDRIVQEKELGDLFYGYLHWKRERPENPKIGADLRVNRDGSVTCGYCGEEVDGIEHFNGSGDGIRVPCPNFLENPRLLELAEKARKRLRRVGYFEEQIRNGRTVYVQETNL